MDKRKSKKFNKNKKANIKFSLLPSIKKDKRGDVPLTILIIGVFGVCTLALISFFYSSLQMNKSFVGVQITEKADLQLETHGLNHIYLYKEVTKFTPEWGLDWFKKKIVFSVEYNP